MMDDLSFLKVRLDLYPHQTKEDREHSPSSHVAMATESGVPTAQDQDERDLPPTSSPTDSKDWNPKQPFTACQEATETRAEKSASLNMRATESKVENPVSENVPSHIQDNSNLTGLPKVTGHLNDGVVEKDTGQPPCCSTPSSTCGIKFPLQRVDNCPLTPSPEETKLVHTSCMPRGNCESPQIDKEEEVIDVGSDGSLDLSVSSRNRKTSPLPTYNTPSPQVPGGQSQLDINPLGFDGLSSFQKPSVAPLYPGNLPAHLIQWLISSQLQSLIQNQQGLSEARRTLFPSVIPGITEVDVQPLDLSSKKHETHFASNDPGTLLSTVLDVKPPPVSTRRKRDMSKRSYTEEELNAALHDIQSGKLGTRRAAVIYGIPRSTLRNKVYKLAMEKERNKKLFDQSTKICSSAPDSTVSVLYKENYFTNRYPRNIPDRHEYENADALKIVLRNNMAEQLEELNKKGQIYLNLKEKKRVIDSALDYLIGNVPNIALNREHKTTPLSIVSSIALYPQLQEFTQQIIEERYWEEIQKVKSEMETRKDLEELNNEGGKSESTCYKTSVPSVSICSDSSEYVEVADPRSPVAESESSQLIPSQPNLKDMIAQIISQKLSQDESTKVSNTPFTNSATLAPIVPLTMKDAYDPLRNLNTSFASADKNTIDISKKRNGSPSTAGGKGSRPKRGKYRNYDRDNLIKAVQAVQSGEMSVHRAGSYYGVPHSTLEYKVKERHLNRGRSKKCPSSPMLNAHLSLTPVDVSPHHVSLDSSKKSPDKKLLPDTTTNDSPERNSTEGSEAIIIQPSKKIKVNHNKDSIFQTYSSLTSNPFLSPQFPFWSRTSLVSHYLPENFYASHVLKTFPNGADSGDSTKSDSCNSSREKTTTPSP